MEFARGRVGRTAFLTLALGLCAFGLIDRWHGVRNGLTELTVGSIAGGMGFVLLGLASSMMLWRAVLADLGSALSLATASRVFFLGQLGKYLPGSVWVVVGQVELGRTYGIPSRRTAATFVVTSLVTLVSGMIVACGLLPFLAAGAVSAYWWMYLAVPIGLVILAPPVLNRLLEKALRWARRPPLELRMSFVGLSQAFGWGLVCWLCFGLQIWFLAHSLGASGGSVFLAAVGGFALAWCVGFLVVFAPAGAGAREAVLVVALASVISTADALITALASRLLMTVGDLAAAAVVSIARPSPPTRGSDGAD
jgi:glycosyltransferase 2 family protein